MEHLGSGNIRNKPSSIAAKKNWSRSGCWSRWGSPCWSPVLGLEGPNRRRCGFRLPVAVACGRRKTTFQNVVLLGMSKWCLINAKYIYICITQLGGGNSNMFLIFTSKIGEDDFQFDEHIFQRGWNHQLDDVSFWMMIFEPLLFRTVVETEKKQHLKMMTTWTSWGNCRYTYCICTRI